MNDTRITTMLRDTREFRKTNAAREPLIRRRVTEYVSVIRLDKGKGPHSKIECGPGSPEQIRTAVTALRGRRPRPLDDGAGHRHEAGELGGEDSNPQ